MTEDPKLLNAGVDRNQDPPAVYVLIDRHLKSGRLDTAHLTPDEAIHLASGLLISAEAIRERPHG